MDGLRAVSALLIVAYHGHELGLVLPEMRLGPLLIPMLDLMVVTGYFGVQLFFFISGFVLFLPYAKHMVGGGPRPSTSQFALRRVAKILPSYLVCLFIVALFLPIPISRAQIPWHVFTHVLFIHSFWPETFASIDGPMWSLAVEVQFYLLFPILCFFLMRNIWASVSVMIAIALVARWHIMGGLDAQFASVYQLPTFLDVFAAGILSAYLVIAYREKVKNRSLFTTLALVGGIAYVGLLSAAHASGGGPLSYIWENANRGWMTLALFTFAIGVLLGGPEISRLFGGRVLLWIAGISYNLYLWNKPILLGLSAAVGPYYLHIPAVTVIFPCLSFGCSIAIATIATYVIERPMQRLILHRGRTA